MVRDGALPELMPVKAIIGYYRSRYNLNLAPVYQFPLSLNVIKELEHKLIAMPCIRTIGLINFASFADPLEKYRING